ncbi:MAG: DUF882 domain-containing protein, partial [Deltaproteobacteria bacterium]|nr:DUF882 domain-containing protein [Deltaproteobacteria bacterium]
QALEHPAPGEKKPTPESWHAERDTLLAERDALAAERDTLTADKKKLLTLRDAMLQEVLPLTQSPNGKTSSPHRWVSWAVVILLTGGMTFLLLQTSRMMRPLQGGYSGRIPATALGQARPRHGGGGASPHARAARPKGHLPGQRDLRAKHEKRVEIIPFATLTVVGRAALSRNGIHVAVAGWGGKILIYDLQSDRIIARFAAHHGAVTALRFADSDTLISGGRDGRIVVWSLRKRARRRVLRAKGPPILDLAVARGYVVVATEETTINVYPLSGNASPTRLVGHRGWVRAVALDARGEHVASGGDDTKIRLWKLPEGKLLRTLPGHKLWVRTLAFSPNGHLLASGGFDKRTRLWDVKSGKLLHSLRGHVRRPVDLAFDATGRRLASASLDRTVVIWDVASGHLLRRLRGHRYQVSSVAFGPRDRFILTSSTDGTLRVWGGRTPTPQITRRLPKIRPGELTLRRNTSGERVRVKLVDPHGKALKTAPRAVAYILRSGPDDREKLLDPKLLEHLYAVAKHFGRQRDVVVISGYRSPQFNALRARQSKQVAKESRHVRGQAIDFRISGVPITTLHTFIKKKRWGGLGFYPDSQFVHLDTGPVRFWQGN